MLGAGNCEGGAGNLGGEKRAGQQVEERGRGMEGRSLRGFVQASQASGTPPTFTRFRALAYGDLYSQRTSLRGRC